MLHVTLPVPRIFCCFPDLYKVCPPLLYEVSSLGTAASVFNLLIILYRSATLFKMIRVI